MPPQPPIGSDPPDSITVNLPSGLVTFTFLPNNHTQITIPPKSPWHPGAHWHEAYIERLRVLQGRLKVIINGHTRLVGAEDGFVTFEKYAVHDFWRADGVEGDVVIEEMTDPGESN